MNAIRYVFTIQDYTGYTYTEFYTTHDPAAHADYLQACGAFLVTWSEYPQ